MKQLGVGSLLQFNPQLRSNRGHDFSRKNTDIRNETMKRPWIVEREIGDEVGPKQMQGCPNKIGVSDGYDQNILTSKLMFKKWHLVVVI